MPIGDPGQLLQRSPDILSAERKLAAEDSQAQAEVDLYRGIVAIYKALGGGWQPDTVVASAK
ncbi:hypothetical protein AO066_03545 [Pseudomonas fluorescens]|nr:hypothetical protein AO066_03545 [Pseudomonas fluorescens]RMP80820.1 hypothetical protein ALQ17_02191 [Pseudomonas fluorescens]